MGGKRWGGEESHERDGVVDDVFAGAGVDEAVVCGEEGDGVDGAGVCGRRVSKAVVFLDVDF